MKNMRFLFSVVFLSLFLTAFPLKAEDDPQQPDYTRAPQDAIGVNGGTFSDSFKVSFLIGPVWPISTFTTSATVAALDTRST
jgi:hypothetical protein